MILKGADRTDSILDVLTMDWKKFILEFDRFFSSNRTVDFEFRFFSGLRISVSFHKKCCRLKRIFFKQGVPFSSFKVGNHSLLYLLRVGDIHKT
ncbi:hypothetical protein DLM75_00450 [Leptospira stimsonii]|uniref:Uncharacterized protein n=1 Tax=Leptospira stimsonii TaxID=2202203 RepID=A0A396Z8Q2_9LEPT|nr:hypothetical protein DLM75_00450 [Leptospira stimsonii]